MNALGERYNIAITNETKNLFRAIEDQHGVKIECEVILDTDPVLNYSSGTGELYNPPKKKSWVTVTIVDPNRRLR